MNDTTEIKTPQAWGNLPARCPPSGNAHPRAYRSREKKERRRVLSSRRRANSERSLTGRWPPQPGIDSSIAQHQPGIRLGETAISHQSLNKLEEKIQIFGDTSQSADNCSGLRPLSRFRPRDAFRIKEANEK